MTVILTVVLILIAVDVCFYISLAERLISLGGGTVVKRKELIIRSIEALLQK